MKKLFLEHSFKKFFFLIFIYILLLGGKIYAQSISKLPTTEILGKEYYVYDVKKNESAYGVAKKFGWNLDELLRLNPEASHSLKKGERLYYPTGQIAVLEEMPQPIDIEDLDIEPVVHTVKKGETLYSISRQYNVPLDVIYNNNPNTKKGVKAGDKIMIPQTGDSQFYFYKVKKGDTLIGLADTYNTSVEDLIKNNAGLKSNNLQEGEIIRISINSNIGNYKKELIAEERVTGISGYKVSRNENWENISAKTGVEVEVLKEANNQSTPKENEMVNIPIIETVEVERQTPGVLTGELSTYEIQEIYDSIKGVDDSDINHVRAALILDEPTSNKDVDFTRGLLTSINEQKNLNYKIDLKIVDGRKSSSDIIDDLDAFEPNLIISTADKTFPLFLADYGNTNSIQIINVFDLKNDLYEDNASIVQILAPSAYFNDLVSSHIYKENRRRKLIGVGEMDENDGVAQELFKLFEENSEILSLEDFGQFEPDVLQPVLIYSFANRKEDISDFLNNVDNLKENYTSADLKIIGRSSWIALTDEFGDKFEEYKVEIPSRIWLDENSEEWKDFAKEYETLFEGYPVRSIPNFAASGYDAGNYFIPLTLENKGDFNVMSRLRDSKMLQTEINLKRVNNWGGFINNTGYIISFGPGGNKYKTILK